MEKLYLLWQVKIIIVSSHSKICGALFSKKGFSWWTNFFGGNLWGIALYRGINDQIISVVETFKNVIPSNLQTKSKDFPQPVWDIHLEIKPWLFFRIIEGFILEVNSSEVLNSSVQFPSCWTWREVLIYYLRRLN